MWSAELPTVNRVEDQLFVVAVIPSDGLYIECKVLTLDREKSRIL